jgi:hypothetical protein
MELITFPPPHTIHGVMRKQGAKIYLYGNSIILFSIFYILLLHWFYFCISLPLGPATEENGVVRGSLIKRRHVKQLVSALQGGAQGLSVSLQRRFVNLQ